MTRLGHAPRANGFTLLELLVVVVIAGIVLSMVVFSATPNPNTQLHQEASRMARLLSLASEEAQLRARPLLLEINREGWRFAVQEGRDLRPLAEEPFQPARWTATLDSLDVVEPGKTRRDGQTLRLLIGREPLDLPATLILRRGAATAVVRADGSGNYSVDPPNS